jgi:beta-lactam-binding protein with PASTA domain
VERVTVPKIVGERFGQAVHDVEAAGLEQHAPAFTGTIGNPNYNGHCKKILSQSPPPGTRLPKGGIVSIVYGVCPHAIANAHHSLKAHH